jgi:quercetin dioxygenase-like cupin family protein
MDTITIADARSFSLRTVQHRPLLEAPDLHVSLICFEAGQRDEERHFGGTSAYQVLEGEARVRQGERSVRLGKGKLLTVSAGEPHTLENAGGGLLVVLATRAQSQ